MEYAKRSAGIKRRAGYRVFTEVAPCSGYPSLLLHDIRFEAWDSNIIHGGGQSRLPPFRKPEAGSGKPDVAGACAATFISQGKFVETAAEKSYVRIIKHGFYQSSKKGRGFAGHPRSPGARVCETRYCLPEFTGGEEGRFHFVRRLWQKRSTLRRMRLHL